jgi:hypothetical protein
MRRCGKYPREEAEFDTKIPALAYYATLLFIL